MVIVSLIDWTRTEQFLIFYAYSLIFQNLNEQYKLKCSYYSKGATWIFERRSVETNLFCFLCDWTTQLDKVGCAAVIYLDM